MEPTDRPAPRNRATKWTARLGLAGVSAIAAVVSYFHALAVVQLAGATPPVAYLVPFLADLVILGASAALLDASRLGQARPPLATVALAAGIAVTLAMNVAAGWGHGLPGALVAGWPAVAFILALESLAGILRRGRDGGLPKSRGSVPATPGHPEPPTMDAALALLLSTSSRRGLASALGVPRSRVDAWAARVAPVAEDTPERSRDGAGGRQLPAVPAATSTPAGGVQDPPTCPAGAGGQGRPALATTYPPAGHTAPGPAGAGLNGGRHG